MSPENITYDSASLTLARRLATNGMMSGPKWTMATGSKYYTRPIGKMRASLFIRQQNQVGTALLFALEDASAPTTERLTVLDEEMLSACAGLNELATARRDGRRLGLMQEARIAREAPACEMAAVRAQAVLDTL